MVRECVFYNEEKIYSPTEIFRDIFCVLAGYELFLLVGGSNGRNEGNGDMQMMMMKSRYDQMWDMFGSCNHKV